MTARTPQDPTASRRAPVAAQGAALPGGPAAPGSPPLAAGGKTPRPEGSPTPLQGAASTSPRDRVRAVAGTEAGSGRGSGHDAAERPLPAGSSGAEWRKRVKAATSALHAGQRRRATRYTPRAERGTGAVSGPGMVRRAAPETPDGAA